MEALGCSGQDEGPRLQENPLEGWATVGGTVRRERHREFWRDQTGGRGDMEPHFH